MNDQDVAKNLLLGHTCDNCKSSKLRYIDQWDDRANTNIGMYVCVNFLRELHITNKVKMAWPYPEDSEGVAFDTKGTCEYYEHC